MGGLEYSGIAEYIRISPMCASDIRVNRVSSCLAGHVWVFGWAAACRGHDIGVDVRMGLVGPFC